MAIEKRLVGQIQHRHDIEANWLKAINFSPKQAEIVIYDEDTTHPRKRIKIGDGGTNINDLPFFGELADSETGSTVLGDSNTNESLSDFTMISGTGNIAGMKGFRIIDQMGESGAEGQYALDSVEGIEVGDVYSVRHSFSAIDRGEIIAIDATNRRVTVSNYYDKALITEDDVSDLGYTLQEYLEAYPWRNSLSFNSKPTLGTITIGVAANATGRNNQALRVGSHVEGNNNIAIGEYSHVEGQSNQAGHIAHAEGRDNIASGEYSHAEGKENKALGFASHVEGLISTAEGSYSHAEGWETKAFGNHSHTEGVNTRTYGTASHAENKSIAYGDYSHAEGRETQAGRQSDAVEFHSAHSEGWETKAWGVGSHAEGYKSRAEGRFSHAEGYNTHALGENSHAEGHTTSAHFWGSHAEGEGTITTAEYQHVQGKYNDPATDPIMVHVIGWGTADAPLNIHTVDQFGNAFYKGDLEIKGNFYPWGNISSLGTITASNGFYGPSAEVTSIQSTNISTGTLGAETSVTTNELYVNGMKVWKSTDNKFRIENSVFVAGALNVNASIQANNGDLITSKSVYANGGNVVAKTQVRAPLFTSVTGGQMQFGIMDDSDSNNKIMVNVARIRRDNATKHNYFEPVDSSSEPHSLGSVNNGWTNLYTDSVISPDGSCTVGLSPNALFIYPNIYNSTYYTIDSSSFYADGPSIPELGKTTNPWTAGYFKKLYEVTDNGVEEVCTTTQLQEVAATKSNTIVAGDRVRVIPQEDGTIQVSAFEGHNYDLNELSIIASGTTTEEIQYIDISTDTAGNELSLRDVVWAYVQVPIAAQDTRMTLWLDERIMQTLQGMSTTQERTSKFIAFFTGYGWDALYTQTLTGQEQGNVATKTKAFFEKTNHVSRVRLGCLTSGHVLPIGTQYIICGRKN